MDVFLSLISYFVKLNDKMEFIVLRASYSMARGQTFGMWWLNCQTTDKTLCPQRNTFWLHTTLVERLACKVNGGAAVFLDQKHHNVYISHRISMTRF